MPVISLLKPEIKEWLQKSIESELYAHFLYSQIANELQRLGYFGTEKYFRNESVDEFAHYNIIVNYVNNMGSVVKIPVLPPIDVLITNIGDALDAYYNAELELARQYSDFYSDIEEEDPMTAQFLLQFLKIQSDSIGEAGDLNSRYQRCGNNEAAILGFDEMMGEKIGG